MIVNGVFYLKINLYKVRETHKELSVNICWGWYKFS